jgi:hypothetical protein
MARINRSRHRFWVLLGIAVVAATTLIPATTASAQGRYGDLTARWWEWVLAQPAVDVGGTNTNPVLDSTGEFAAVGQEDGIGPGSKYFFLTGTFGETFTRTVTVPQGKILFFPIFNIETDNAADPPTSFTVPELRTLAAASIDGAIVERLVAELDDEAVEIFRTTSPAFNYTVPEENSLYDYFGLVGPQFEGTIGPAVGDGYWAVIPPLAPGDYVLEIESAAPGFTIDVTYNLTIE